MTTALVAGEGYAVMEAKNGEEGLARAIEHGPDVVLLDLASPRMSGLDVLRELKRAPATAATPVLIVSAYALLVSDEDAQQQRRERTPCDGADRAQQEAFGQHLARQVPARCA